MCGICGIYHLEQERTVDENLLRKMVAAMHHRGPDDEGYHLDKYIGLGHSRLSIIDLAGGHQPMYNEDRTICIVGNGEIYNYKALMHVLKSKGHRFLTNCDVETILHAYETYGLECIDHFRGMFAFAIWDSNLHRLLIVRDRIGIKPVYYTLHDGTLYFASEIKAILHNPSIPREICIEALNYFLRLRYVPDPMTMFKGINKVPPGGYLISEGSEINIRIYWDLSYRSSGDTNMRDWIDRFKNKALEAVNMRLMSDVPLGAFLSGGLDSSLVVAFMSQMNKDPVKTFSVGYKDKPHISEFAYARQVADRFDSDHHELEILAGEFRESIPQMIWYLDEPVADHACLPLFFLSKLTKEHVTVILSGEGADEMLAGYYLYQKMLLIERLRKVPALGNALSIVGAVLPEGKLRRYLQQAKIPLNNRYRGISTAFTDQQSATLMRSTKTYDDLIEEFTSSVFNKVAGQHPLNQMLYFDTRVYLPGDLLIKADKMTMAWSLELRVPFLDHEMLELAASLPVGAKLNGKETKVILREIGRTILPRDVLDRPKKGFPVPTNEWFAEDLSDFARQSLLTEKSSLREMFDFDQIKKILDRHERGEEDCADRIWALIVLESWKRIFIDAPIIAAP